MRTTGLLIISLVLLGGCKTAQVPGPTANIVFEEDLSVLRPDLNQVETENDSTVTFTQLKAPSLESTLIQELDSVNQIIIANNLGRRVVDGFTIQIYTGNNREDAESARQMVLSLFPDLSPQVSYYQPSYKVKVGQYTDRLEAHRVFESLKEDFPQALLIPERIELKYE